MKKFLTVTIAVIMIAVTLFGCTDVMAEKMIVGTWTAETNILGVVAETEYSFYEDGTGSMTTMLGIGIAIDYTIDEEKIIITTDTPTIQKTDIYTYEFVEDQLILTSDDVKIVLTKKQ